MPGKLADPGDGTARRHRCESEAAMNVALPVVLSGLHVDGQSSDETHSYTAYGRSSMSGGGLSTNDLHMGIFRA